MEFVTVEHNGSPVPGIRCGEHVFDLNQLGLSRPFHTLTDFIENHSASDLAAVESKLQAEKNACAGDCADLCTEDTKLLSPIAKPVHDILCVGLNYQKHIEESETMLKEQGDIPKHAAYFSKRAYIVLGHGDALALDDTLDDALDYEVELAVVIGKQGKNIHAGEALEYVFGYTILNDFSARTIQQQHGQWFRGKSLDGYVALGPSIVHRSRFAHPLALDIRLCVNGDVRQQSNTHYMIRGVAELIAELSRGMTLVPGDIIATGTPEGVGMGFNPPRFLRRGDVVMCTIEGIGTLENRII